MSAHETWRFGVYEVDTRKMQVRRAGVPIKLRDQSFLILVHLLEHAGEIVTHDELCRVLWPTDTFVDFDHSLRTAVMKLRDALGDSVDAPVYIETIPKRGYRFVAPVVAGDGESFASSLTIAEADAVLLMEKLSGSEKVSANAALERKHRRWLPWSVGVVFLVVAAGILWRVQRPAPQRAELKALVQLSGDARMASLSPDGSRIVFAWNGGKGDTHNLYVQQIGSAGPPVRLTEGPANERYPAWSPDGRWIAFLRDQQQFGESSALLLIPSLGGPERLLAKIVVSLDEGDPGSNLSWTPDGKWLAYAAMEAILGPYSIWAISIETGERRRLTTFPTQSESADVNLGDRNPSFSPDGSMMAFSRSVHLRVFQLYALRLTRNLQPEGEMSRFTDQQYPYVGGIAWTADSHELVFAAGEVLGTSLWRLSVLDRKPAQRLAIAEPGSSDPAINGSQHRLVYTSTVYAGRFLRLDTTTGQVRSLFDTTTSSGRPAYSPDGSKIAFASTSRRTGGNSEIWTCDAEGVNCVQLTHFNGPRASAPSWSPDGRLISFTARAEGIATSYLISADGGNPHRLGNFPADEIYPSFSHEGTWVYFGSNRNVRNEIWKAPVNGGQEVQVTQSGGYAALESPDGKYLYYTKSRLSGIYRIPVSGGTEEQIVPKVVRGISFAVTRKGVYFQPNESTVKLYDQTNDRITTLASLDAPGIPIAVSPDDRYIVWFERPLQAGSLMQVENFR